MLSRRNKWLVLAFILAPLISSHAQYELPNEIFERTILIRNGKEMSTAFKFDQGGRIYLVTTRHLVKGLPIRNAVVQVFHDQSWTDLQTLRILFPDPNDVDLAILETAEKTARPYKVVKSSEVLTTGQKVWSIGWVGPIVLPKLSPGVPPFNPLPMTKIGTITAINATQNDSFEIHLNATGVYNLRIAPGPIVYWSPVHKDFEILGVIERDEKHAEWSAVNGGQPVQIVKSDTIKAYGIDLVVETITSHPKP
jgi:hypothetical protein